MPKVKVGIIGTGALGRFHSKLYAQSPNAEVVGIFDVHQDAARRVGAEFGLNVFSSWESLADQCDALSVAVPATLHASTVMPLLAMGKHILVEKPIASTKEDAEKMVALAAEKNVVFGVGHVERFNPCMESLEKYAGRIRFIEAQRLAPYPPARPGMPRRGTEVSVILDLMIHDIDLVLHTVRSEVERIDVTGAPLLSGTEDIVHARIKFKNGVCAFLTASRVSPEPMRVFRVFQDDGSLSLDLGKHTAMAIRRSDGELLREDLPVEETNALAMELEDFISAVRRTKADGILHETRVPGREALEALKLALAIETESRRYNQQYGF